MIRLAILLLRPIEIYWSWSVNRAYRKGKFKYHPDQGRACVTTRRKETV